MNKFQKLVSIAIVVFLERFMLPRQDEPKLKRWATDLAILVTCGPVFLAALAYKAGKFVTSRITP